MLVTIIMYNESSIILYCISINVKGNYKGNYISDKSRVSIKSLMSLLLRFDTITQIFAENPDIYIRMMHRLFFIITC